jgi:hypothetical protein
VAALASPVWIYVLRQTYLPESLFEILYPLAQPLIYPYMHWSQGLSTGGHASLKTQNEDVAIITESVWRLFTSCQNALL